MDLEDRVSLIKMRIEKFRRTYELKTDPTVTIKLFENKNDHVWWFCFNDITNTLIASKKNQLIEPFITVSIARLFNETFRESMVLELLWEDKIDYIINDKIKETGIKKISFIKLIRKYLSKKLRILFN